MLFLAHFLFSLLFCHILPLPSLQVDEFDDIKSGFRLRFFFTPNEFFENEKIEKEYNLGDTPSTTGTTIRWKEGKNLGKVGWELLFFLSSGSSFLPFFFANCINVFLSNLLFRRAILHHHFHFSNGLPKMLTQHMMILLR